MFNPGPEVTVDERLLPFRGKCPFRQYIPSKPGKYGIKIWAACDAKNSYAWNLQIYTGKAASGIPEKNQGKRVVLDMTTGLQGHNITCDNFFTSFELGQELLRRKLTMVGTMKKNKPELPAERKEGQGSTFLKTAAELTYHSVHIISNTKSILAGILLSQPCLSTNQTSHSRNPIQAT
ncbi:hypothetical protein D5F01_LYC05571 [Larimichthys crocea]|uniref:PiggyBac transposable element-derived protein domain-containing protein n=1 Tax=Larimichthys crocea TaxID=215358 RepID=A0A6G0IZ56_LARCR|nr:hypothetical protein D5F01_LYC05571 [Larimichthys crocea]